MEEVVKITDMIDWTKVTDNEEVIRLIKEREKIEEQIRDIDEMALVRYELESLQELNEASENLNISDVSDSVNNKVVYIVIDQDMHSYESILGIYDTFEGAMNCNAWSNRGIVPNQNGEGGSLFIYKEYVNEELSPKY